MLSNPKLWRCRNSSQNARHSSGARVGRSAGFASKLRQLPMHQSYDKLLMLLTCNTKFISYSIRKYSQPSSLCGDFRFRWWYRVGPPRCVVILAMHPNANSLLYDFRFWLKKNITHTLFSKIRFSPTTVTSHLLRKKKRARIFSP